MITLNQIVDQFNNIAVAHKDINSFNFGDIWEIGASGDTKYPQLYAIATPASFTERTIQYSFNIITMDRVNTGERGETDTLSDMALVMADFLALLDHPDYEWDLIKTGSATPFTESFEDSVTGWNASITLEVPFLYDRCAVPANTITINQSKTKET